MCVWLGGGGGVLMWGVSGSGLAMSFMCIYNNNNNKVLLLILQYVISGHTNSLVGPDALS